MSLSMSEYVFSEESGSGNVSVEGPAGFNVRVVAGMYENSNLATKMRSSLRVFIMGRCKNVLAVAVVLTSKMKSILSYIANKFLFAVNALHVPGTVVTLRELYPLSCPGSLAGRALIYAVQCYFV